jgi:hypothetical protein
MKEFRNFRLLLLLAITAMALDKERIARILRCRAARRSEAMGSPSSA